MLLLKLNIALVDMRRSLLLSLEAALVTAASTAEADFLMGDDEDDAVMVATTADVVGAGWVRLLPLTGTRSPDG